MGAAGGAAGIDLRGDAGGFPVAGAHGLGEGLDVGGGDQIDGAAAEASASKARAEAAGLFAGQRDQDVDLLAGRFEVVAQADVGLAHQLAEVGQVGDAEGIGGGQYARVLGDDVAAALEHAGGHLAAPLVEVGHRGVAQRHDLGPVLAQDVRSSFNLRAAAVVLAFGYRVPHHGVADDDAYVRRDGGELELQPAAVDHDGVVLLSAATDELVHDAAVGADEGVFRALAEQGDLGRRQVQACGAEDGERSGHLHRGRRAESGIQRNVAGNRHREAVVDGDTVFAQRPQDSGGIVRPIGPCGRRAARQSRRRAARAHSCRCARRS